MPAPRLGQRIYSGAEGPAAPMADTQSHLEDIQHAPQPEVLGEIKAKPKKATAWEDPETKKLIEMEEGPPPWEVQGRSGANAREYISCPDNWELRWINPKHLDAFGWRGWMHVRAADERVKVKIPGMVSVEGMVRRGGQGGDILAYMPKHWYEQRRQQFTVRAQEQMRSSVERTEAMKDEFRRGAYPGITIEAATHPTHTRADLTGVND